MEYGKIIDAKTTWLFLISTQMRQKKQGFQNRVSKLKECWHPDSITTSLPVTSKVQFEPRPSMRTRLTWVIFQMIGWWHSKFNCETYFTHLQKVSLRQRVLLTILWKSTRHKNVLQQESLGVFQGLEELCPPETLK